MKPKRTQKIKWSPEVAYVVGLIATDGCLYNDGRHIDFTSKDIQLLRTFKKCLGLKNKIGFKSSSFTKKKIPHIQFCDIVFYKWLTKIGLTPHKSKRISGIKIPNKYFFDFVRGCFDGDGSCYSYWDSRWKNSFMFYISFYSGNLNFINWLREKLRVLLRIKGHIRWSSRCWKLSYAKKESKILFSRMYHKENLPCLIRKYKKLKRILEIEKNNGRVVELADTTV